MAASVATAVSGNVLKPSTASPPSVVVVDTVTSAFPMSSSSPSSVSLLSNCSSSMSSPPACPAVAPGGLVVVQAAAAGGNLVNGVAGPPAATSAAASAPAAPASAAASGKDSGWLTLEVCREHVRQRCTRPDSECRFAHPPPHVDMQNGRVVCCFDSIKGRCQRTDPPCKYLHPPQHLKEQLLQNGRNNLIMKNLQQIQRVQHTAVLPNTATPYFPVVNPYVVVNPSSWFTSYYNAGSMQPAIVPPTSGHNGCVSMAPAVAAPTATVAQTADQSSPEVEAINGNAVDVPYTNVQTMSQAGTQYWTLSPSGGIYAANPPFYPHCSAVYYQNGSYGLPTAPATAVLVPKRAQAASTGGVIDGSVKNGYTPANATAVYPCSSAAYQQMALSAGPMDMPSCYAMAITVPPPVNGFYGC